VKATLLYTLARLGVFVVLFAVLRFTPLSVYLAAAVAAILALLISYIFFGRLRRGVAESIVRRRAAPERDEDADLEDAALDGTDSGASTVKSRPAAGSRQAPPAEDA
jgi:hypothetical protein